METFFHIHLYKKKNVCVPEHESINLFDAFTDFGETVLCSIPTVQHLWRPVGSYITVNVQNKTLYFFLMEEGIYGNFSGSHTMHCISLKRERIIAITLCQAYWPANLKGSPWKTMGCVAVFNLSCQWYTRCIKWVNRRCKITHEQTVSDCNLAPQRKICQGEEWCWTLILCCASSPAALCDRI